LNSSVPIRSRSITSVNNKTESVVVGGQATATFGPETVKVKVPPTMPRGYEFRDHLGQGGMGVVVRAYEIAADREVALKVVRAKTDDAARKRFRVEAQSLARLKHPNVVQVFSVEVDSPEPFFTMEIVKGPSLDKLFKAGPMPIAEAVRIIAGAARGIGAAHAAGIVHRDIKPSNIILSPDGTPKVTDFGLAKRTDRDDQLTIPEAMLGTPSYMAPEQAGRRQAEIGPLSDVYSLGATLYALLAGEPPFVADEPVMTAALVLTAPPKPLRELRPEVSEDLERIVFRAMEKDATRRYGSANELADALERWGRGEIDNRPRPKVASKWLAIARRPATIALALLAVSLVVFGGAWAWIAQKPTIPPNSYEEMRRDLNQGKTVVLIGETDERKYPTRWAYGVGSFGKSITGDGTLLIGTNQEGVLELLDDPGVFAYELSAELRLETPAPGASPDDHLGIYVGYQKHPFANAVQAVHTFIALSFNDYDPNPPGGTSPRRASLRAAAFAEQPNVVPVTERRIFAALPIASNAKTPCPWHTLVIHVTPQSFSATYDGKVVSAGKQTTFAPDRVAKTYLGLQEDFDKNVLNNGAVIRQPPLNTPLGLWIHRANISVKNVKLTPAP